MAYNFIFAIDNFDFKCESDKIVKLYLKDLKQKEKIWCTGLGGGSRGEINLISIDLESNRIVKIDEARMLIISAVKELFKRFNENKTIRPYLHNYPFGIENIDFHIGFNKNVGDPEQVSYVSLGSGEIYYYCFRESTDLFNMHKETFNEALKIVSSQLLLKE